MSKWRFQGVALPILAVSAKANAVAVGADKLTAHARIFRRPPWEFPVPTGFSSGAHCFSIRCPLDFPAVPTARSAAAHCDVKRQGRHLRNGPDRRSTVGIARHPVSVRRGHFIGMERASPLGGSARVHWVEVRESIGWKCASPLGGSAQVHWLEVRESIGWK